MVAAVDASQEYGSQRKFSKAQFISVMVDTTAAAVPDFAFNPQVLGWVSNVDKAPGPLSAVVIVQARIEPECSRTALLVVAACFLCWIVFGTCLLVHACHSMGQRFR